MSLFHIYSTEHLSQSSVNSRPISRRRYDVTTHFVHALTVETNTKLRAKKQQTGSHSTQPIDSKNSGGYNEDKYCAHYHKGDLCFCFFSRFQYNKRASQHTRYSPMSTAGCIDAWSGQNATRFNHAGIRTKYDLIYDKTLTVLFNHTHF